jgi:hypothetical protein
MTVINVLQNGPGKIEHQIFSRNYTFAENAEVPAEPRTISVEFYDEEGDSTSSTWSGPYPPTWPAALCAFTSRKASSTG